MIEAKRIVLNLKKMGFVNASWMKIGDACYIEAGWFKFYDYDAAKLFVQGIAIEKRLLVKENFIGKIIARQYQNQPNTNKIMMELNAINKLGDGYLNKLDSKIQLNVLEKLKEVTELLGHEEMA